jgi:hypothetical protein
LARGDAENLRRLMIHLEKTRISFQLPVRNRLLVTYPEVMRVQVRIPSTQSCVLGESTSLERLVLKEYWQGIGRRSRIGSFAVIVVIAVGTAAMTTWLMQTHHELVSGTLSPHDAASMTAKLDRMKLPYEVGTDGTSILVDGSTMHQTRQLAVIEADLDIPRREPMKTLVGAAAGASQERRDTVVVPSMDALGRSLPAVAKERLPAHDEVLPATKDSREGQAFLARTLAVGTSSWATWVAIAIAVLVLSSGIVFWGVQRELDAGHAPSGEMRLDRGQREAALAQVRHWLASDGAGRPNPYR